MVKNTEAYNFYESISKYLSLISLYMFWDQLYFLNYILIRLRDYQDVLEKDTLDPTAVKVTTIQNINNTKNSLRDIKNDRSQAYRNIPDKLIIFTNNYSYIISCINDIWINELFFTLVMVNINRRYFNSTCGHSNRRTQVLCASWF